MAYRMYFYDKKIGDDCTLDIHGGGNDLIFPHHENEITQGSCISTRKYCNYWFHNGIVLVNKENVEIIRKCHSIR